MFKKTHRSAKDVNAPQTSTQSVQHDWEQRDFTQGIQLGMVRCSSLGAARFGGALTPAPLGPGAHRHS